MKKFFVLFVLVLMGCATILSCTPSSKPIQNSPNTSGIIFTNNEPRFTLTLPKNISLVKYFDSNRSIAYRGETDTIMCQLTITDMYSLTDLQAQGYARRMHDYNMYSKNTMDAAYDGYVKGAIANSPYGDVVNAEHSIQKINNVTFIFLKYEIPNEEGSRIRQSYNFLVNGYSIHVVGIYFNADRNAEIEIDNYLRSIKF